MSVTILFSILSGSVFALPRNKTDEIEKLIMKNLYSKALSNIQDIESLYPDDSELFLLKGICYYNISNLKSDAPALLGRALMLSRDKSEKIDITYHLGKAYAANNDYNNAEKCYTKLLTMVPEEFAEFKKHLQELLTECQKAQLATALPPQPKDTVAPQTVSAPASTSTTSVNTIASTALPTQPAVTTASNAAQNVNAVAAPIAATTNATPNITVVDSATVIPQHNAPLITEQSENSVDITPPLPGNANNKANIAALPTLNPSAKQQKNAIIPTTNEEVKYTIQICTMSFPLSDSFFKGQYGIKVVKMNDLYKYIYNTYTNLESAAADLNEVRKIYPDAFIREYYNNKLGKLVKLTQNTNN